MHNKKPTTQPLLPSSYYHIYNRGNDKGQLFYVEENYQYFLEKYTKYMGRYWDTYAWALMGNHFHFLISVKSKRILEQEACKDFQKIGGLFYNHHQLELHTLIEQARVGVGLDARVGEQHLTDFQNLLDVRLAQRTYILDLSFEKLIKLARIHNATLYQQILSWVVSERFRRFVQGYAKAINKQQNRTGSLFQDRYKSKAIVDKVHAKTVL